MVVFVVGKDGKPLMPTKRFGKVRKLLKEKQAKIINRNPFTIQLLYETKHYTQPVKVGIDPGATMGFAIVTDNGLGGKVIEKGEIRFRRDISKLLLQRKEYRKSRRYRKTRYRKPRFLNRRRPEGWLAVTGFTGNYAYIQDIDGNYIKMEGKSYKQVSLKQTTFIRRNNNWIEQVIAA